jgi:hypothetical protein
MESPRRLLGAAWAAAFALAGCTARIHKLDVAECPAVTTTATDAVNVRYLGVGGVLLRRGSDVILTAPLYSNPGLVEFAADHQIRPDPMAIDRLFPDEGKAAQAILVGHSHYDHLMDVPYVALNLARSADVYGSQTTVNLLDSIRKTMQANGHDVYALDEKALDPSAGQPGTWTSITKTMRVLAIRSEHSDQFEMSTMGLSLPFHMFRGGQDTPLSALPEHPSGWPEGRVFAYLIDFLDGSGTPVFRVYYQDSGADKDVGLPSRKVLEDSGRDRVDLAIVCLGGAFERLRDHPEALVTTLRPRFVLFAHWEDFFVTQRAACSDEVFRGLPTTPRLFGFLRQTEVGRFRGRFEAAAKTVKPRPRSWLPCPTASTFAFPVGDEPIDDDRPVTFDCEPFYRYPAAK